jgi:two-component system nitrogen regulation sensor histidine kinase NtrY
MSLQRPLFVYLMLVHAAFFGIALLFFHTRPLVVVAIELALLGSYVIGHIALRRALLPLDFSRQFQDLLQDENYAARLKLSTNRDTNTLVTLFNRMLDALYQERLRLGEQRGFLDQLLEATPSAVIVFDFDANISLCNACAHEVFGTILQMGKPLSQIGEIDKNRQFLQELMVLTVGESRVISDDNGRRFRCQRSQFVDRGFRRDFLMIDEITDELASSEKETYEKVVRVLAHEVNNTVAATGSVMDSLLFYRAQLTEEDAKDFSTAIFAVQKRTTNLAQFIERFTQVVKMPEPHLETCDLNEMLESALVLYRQRCNERGIELGWGQRDIAPALALDRHLFEQALMNIVKNAIEAAEAAQAKNVSAAHFVRIDLALDQNTGAVKLSIIDSGKGLQKIASSQLFTPFFTTKKGGQGIGLMFVREVLNRHGFSHRLAENAEGQTQFDILLV